MILACALMIFCCGESNYEVKYVVDGSASKASLTYNNESGDSSQESDVRIPWEKTLTAKKGQFLYISAQNSGDSGSIKTEIYVDGKKVKESTSEGGYAIATSSCSAGE